jgi:acyl-CoA thioesterase-2
MPPGVPDPETLKKTWDAGIERCEFARRRKTPHSMLWARFPSVLEDADPIHACALAYLSDMNAMDAITNSRPGGVGEPGDAGGGGEWGEGWMGVSIDHAVWFHRPVRVDDWLLIDFSGHGLIRTRGLATGLVFDRRGTHVATIAQEGLLRTRSK